MAAGLPQAPRLSGAVVGPADLVGDYRAGGHVWNVGTTLTLSWDVAIGRGAGAPSARGAR